MNDERQVYRPSTGGQIYLSFTARHLMQSLREAIQDALLNSNYSVHDRQLSRARAKLAEHISELETEVQILRNRLKDVRTVADVSHWTTNGADCTPGVPEPKPELKFL